MPHNALKFNETLTESVERGGCRLANVLIRVYSRTFMSTATVVSSNEAA